MTSRNGTRRSCSILNTMRLYHLKGERVTLQFPDFALEKSANCSFDYLELREGIDETGKLIGRLCGEGDPGVFRSSRSLRLTFVSDASISLRGFAARYFKYGMLTLPPCIFSVWLCVKPIFHQALFFCVAN